MSTKHKGKSVWVEYERVEYAQIAYLLLMVRLELLRVTNTTGKISISASMTPSHLLTSSDSPIMYLFSITYNLKYHLANEPHQSAPIERNHQPLLRHSCGERPELTAKHPHQPPIATPTSRIAFVRVYNTLHPQPALPHGYQQFLGKVRCRREIVEDLL